jgi:uncharacterized protein
MKNRVGGDLIAKSEWIEMFPYGLVVNPDQTRPVMIFKDKSQKRVLPVWMSPVDAGVAVSQTGGQEPDASPHHLTSEIFKLLGLKLEQCFFKELKGHYQIVELHFSGDPRVAKVEARADEAISFCLSQGTQFFSTIEFMERCRVLEGELLTALVKTDKKDNYKHPYLN